MDSDASIMGREAVQKSVTFSFLDEAVSVRQASEPSEAAGSRLVRGCEDRMTARDLSRSFEDLGRGHRFEAHSRILRGRSLSFFLSWDLS